MLLHRLVLGEGRVCGLPDLRDLLRVCIVMSSSTRVSLMLVFSQARSGSKRSPLQRHRRPVARLPLQPPREPPCHFAQGTQNLNMFRLDGTCPIHPDVFVTV
jgi:hypothetical protein